VTERFTVPVKRNWLLTVMVVVAVLFARTFNELGLDLIEKFGPEVTVTVRNTDRTIGPLVPFTWIVYV
jgi:hypothetical protein